MRSDTANDMKDGELLEAFRTLGDQNAFTALVRRHGQMVHGTARAMVGDDAVAEDVAQAAFLALARKAGMLEGADSVAGWLYHVALCLARNEYRAQVRRKAREEEAAMIVVEPDSGTLAEDVMSALYEELGTLAEKYRQPVILHHLEGLSYEAAATMCGCSEQAFGVRLMRARQKLRERLAKRGVTLGMTALMAGLGQGASAAELPAGFVASTCAAAGGGAVSAQVSALMESALKMLFWAKVKTVTAVCAVVVLVGGAGVGVAVTLPIVLKPAATTAATNERLSPEDAWVRELLARAEAGSWEALDLKHGEIIGDPAVWRADLHGEPADRRIWQTDARASSTVQLDAAKWKRGVLVGRVMMLPEGELPSALAVPAEATAPWEPNGSARIGGDIPNGAYMGFHWGSKLSLTSAMTVKDHPRAVWHRFALYFDTAVEPKTVVAIALMAWPEDRTVPSAALWDRSRKEDFGGITGKAVGIALYARQVPVLWQGVKVVPLGPDMPLLPPGVGAGREKVNSDQ